MARAEIRTRASLDNQPFRRGLGEMRREVQGFASGQLRSIGGMIGGAFAVGALVNFARKQLEMADGMVDLSNNVGVGVEAIQALNAETIKFGGSAEDVAKSLSILKKTQGDALSGNKGLRESFAALGISTRDLANMTPEQLFEAVANGYRNAGESAQAYNAVSDILGRGGKELVGVLRSVAADGLQSLIDKGKEAGTVLEEQLIEKLSAAQDQLDLLGKTAGNSFTRWAAASGTWVQDVAAFWGAASAVGIREASRQVQMGELGSDADMRAAQEQRKKESDARAAAERAAAKQQRAAFLEGEIEKLQGKIKVADLEKLTVTAPQAADARAAIGGFTGAQANPMRGLAERQLKVQEEIAKIDKDNAKILEEIAGLQAEQRDLLKE